MKLLIVASHPIQYHAPLYRVLDASPDVDVLVAFGRIPDAVDQGEGFGVAFAWDIPLREGYRSEVFAGSLAASRSVGSALSAVGSLVQLLRGERPDAVLLTGWYDWSLVIGFFVAHFAGLPLLLRCDNNGLKLRSGWQGWMHRFLLAHFSVVLPVGVANRKYYRDFGVADDRMVEALHFVENDRIASSAAEFGEFRSDLRRQWRIASGQFCVLYCGKLVPKKRVGDLVSALGGMDGVSGLIVGDGELRADLEARAAACGAACSFVGFLNQSEIAKAYAVADVLVLPSDEGETWGLVVNEAMACGVPCIVSDRVGCREDLIEEGVTGWSYPMGEIDQLRAILEELRDGPGILLKAGEAAREKVAAYSVEAASAGVINGLRLAVSRDEK